MKQFFDVPDTQGKVSNNEREELVRELRRELGLGGGGGGGRGKSLQVPWQLETGIHFFLLEKILWIYTHIWLAKKTNSGGNLSDGGDRGLLWVVNYV